MLINFTQGARYTEERSQLKQGIISIETICSDDYLSGKIAPIQKAQA